MDNKRTCQTCKHKHSCLERSTFIFLTYIVTGRDQEAKAATEHVNLHEDCAHYEENGEIHEER